MYIYHFCCLLYHFSNFMAICSTKAILNGDSWKKKKQLFNVNFQTSKRQIMAWLIQPGPSKQTEALFQGSGAASIITGAQATPTSGHSWSLNTCVAEHSTELVLLDIIPSYQAPHEQLWGCQRQVIIETSRAPALHNLGFQQTPSSYT